MNNSGETIPRKNRHVNCCNVKYFKAKLAFRRMSNSLKKWHLKNVYNVVHDSIFR